MARKKAMKTKVMEKTKQLKTTAVHHDLPKKIAKGAAGVAVTAGVVAVGAALMDQDTRDKMGEKARQGFGLLKDTASQVTEETAAMYEVTPHQVRTSQSNAKKKTGAKKTSKR